MGRTIWILILGLLLNSICYAHQWQQIFIEHKTQNQNHHFLMKFDVGYALPKIRNDPFVPPPFREWLLKQDEAQHAAIRKEAKLILNQILLFRSGAFIQEPIFTFPDWLHNPPQFPKLIDGFAYISVEMKVPKKTDSALSLEIIPSIYTPNVLIAKEGTEYITLKAGDTLLLEPNHSKAASFSQLNTTSRPFIHNVLTGFLHVIPEGIDHVLFILTMYFAAHSLRHMLSFSLIFTLCHSLSFALIYQRWILLNPSMSALIEWLILGSIVAMALTNLRTDSSALRSYILVCVFGLIHGLGFANSLLANVLTDIPVFLVLAVATGIEMAQAAILVMAFLLSYFLIKPNLKGSVNRWCNIAVAIAGMILIASKMLAP